MTKKGEKYSPDWDHHVLRHLYSRAVEVAEHANPHVWFSEDALAINWDCFASMGNLVEAVADFMGVVDIAEVNSLRTMVSRAVRRLVKRGFVAGWYRCWWANGNIPSDLFGCADLTGEYPWSGAAKHICSDGTNYGKRQGPRYAYLQLTDKGIQHCHVTWPDLAKRERQIRLQWAASAEQGWSSEEGREKWMRTLPPID